MQSKTLCLISFIGGLSAITVSNFFLNTLRYQSGLYSHILGKQLQCKMKNY
jgi:uncharacterized membrane protein YwzB